LQVIAFHERGRLSRLSSRSGHVSSKLCSSPPIGRTCRRGFRSTHEKAIDVPNVEFLAIPLQFVSFRPAIARQSYFEIHWMMLRLARQWDCLWAVRSCFFFRSRSILNVPLTRVLRAVLHGQLVAMFRHARNAVPACASGNAQFLCTYVCVGAISTAASVPRMCASPECASFCELLGKSSP
jgi:hypothetical protein